MRCAGSTDSHRLRTSTCPSAGWGIGASFQRNSFPDTLPEGRAIKIHWRFLLSVIGCLLSRRVQDGLGFVSKVTNTCAPVVARHEAGPAPSITNAMVAGRSP